MLCSDAIYKLCIAFLKTRSYGKIKVHPLSGLKFPYHVLHCVITLRTKTSMAYLERLPGERLFSLRRTWQSWTRLNKPQDSWNNVLWTDDYISREKQTQHISSQAHWCRGDGLVWSNRTWAPCSYWIDYKLDSRFKCEANIDPKDSSSTLKWPKVQTSTN